MSGYRDDCFVLVTKHHKSAAVAPPFWNHLHAAVIESVMDTDTLGTFTGEIPREGDALSCARRKALWARDILGDRVPLVLASEGSFGPHPMAPFVPCDREVLYLVDEIRGFHLHLSLLSLKTNYRQGVICSRGELESFARHTAFPGHGLIVRAGANWKSPVAAKGIDHPEQLYSLFDDLLKQSPDGIWVETDMRAHMNPTRMSIIGELAEKMAARLSCHCPVCDAPAWGVVGTDPGLPCESCGHATDMVMHEILGCVLCSHRETRPRPDGLVATPPVHCPLCNP